MPTINFTVDGKPVSVNADNNEELLWVLRDRLGVNSVKYGCGVGLDGVCTAIVTQSSRPASRRWARSPAAT